MKTIAFNDSYKADGFVESVQFINEQLERYGLKVVVDFIDDDDFYTTIDEEFAYNINIEAV